MNRIFDYLPQAYQNDPEQKQIVEALTIVLSDKLTELKEKLYIYELSYLNPNTAQAEWLDSIAYWHGWGDFWDSSWSDKIKRKLLTNSDFIWRNRGNRLILPFLFDIFELDARLEPETGFTLSSDLVPEFFTNEPFAYRITYNSNYTTSSKDYQLILNLSNFFLPCWISLRLIPYI